MPLPLRPLACIALGLSALLGTPAAFAAAQSVGVPLKPVKLSPEAAAALCARVQPACTADSVGLYGDAKAQTGWRYYLLDSSAPQVWVSQDSAFTEPRFWSYKVPHQDEGESTNWRLYPALYRTGTAWAWAVVSYRSRAYSGGGDRFEVADFVAFDWGDAPRVHYAAIPFSCSSLVRACFAEKDYEAGRKVGHCHDENWGHLRIHQGQRPATADDPAWQFVWHQTDWPAFVPKTKAKSQTTVLPVKHGQPSQPGAHTTTANSELMCGGMNQ